MDYQSDYESPDKGCRVRSATWGRGQAVTEYAPEELRRSIGYVIQDAGLFPHLTIAANVATVPRLLDLPARWGAGQGDPRPGGAALKDKTKPIQERREALFFVCHFIEDLHQPLHCSDREKDRGGNLVKVQMPDGGEYNLHAVWDSPLVDVALGPFTPEDYAGRLTSALTAEQRKDLQKGTVEDWVDEGTRSPARRCTPTRGPRSQDPAASDTRCPRITSWRAR
jgi:ABC-type Fe3+/spermidine/putrescine transport system ATPase subunit